MDLKINYQCPINGHISTEINVEELLEYMGVETDAVVYSVKVVSKDGDELDTYVDSSEITKDAFHLLKTLMVYRSESLKASLASRDWRKFRQFLADAEREK